MPNWEYYSNFIGSLGENRIDFHYGATGITLRAWGAGGAGGKVTSANKKSGGGGGGAYAHSNYENKDDIFTFTSSYLEGLDYLICYVGSGGNGDGSTIHGESSYWKAYRYDLSTSAYTSDICVLAAGGSGVTTNNGSGAVGGTSAASTGQVKYNGGDGAKSGSTYGGGGGGGAGSGEDGGDAIAYTGGSGGDDSGGSGGDGYHSIGSGEGSNGNVYGGGGGGSINGASGSLNGGDGAQGAVQISYWYPTNVVLNIIES